MTGGMLPTMRARLTRVTAHRGRLVVLGAVVAALLLWKVPQWQTAAWRAFLPPKDLLLVENELRRTLVLLAAMVCGVLGLLMLWRRAAAADRAAHAAEVARRGERFTRAVGQLADARPEVRLGAIYGLEQLAAESADQHWPAMEVLCAFLRERAAWHEPPAAEPPPALAIDVQAVLTVLGRRRRDAEVEPGEGSAAARARLDLRRTDLRGADLNGMHLERAILREAHLEGASLQGAQLAGADLRGAHLRNADLVEADLRGADLREAHVESAYLVEAHLEGTDLGGAHLGGAYLGGAHLEGADLGGAQLDGAYMYQAHLDDAALHGVRAVSTIGIPREPAAEPESANAPAAPQPISLRRARRR